MQFDDDANLDTSEVRDARQPDPPGAGRPSGGGVVGLIALLLALFLGIGPEQLGLSSGGDRPKPTASSLAQVQQTCRTGRDANTRDDCRVVAVVNSVQDYWRQEFRRRGRSYSPSPTVFFGGRVGTACGTATSAVGPFYCPGDRRVYLDLGFFGGLRTRFGASGGLRAGLRGGARVRGITCRTCSACSAGPRTARPARTAPRCRGASGGLLRGRLGAARDEARPTRSTGRPLVTRLTAADIRDGLDAAAAVGDDRIRAGSRGG